MHPPDLSIIIPTLNEEICLPLLLSDLAQQQGVSFEVIVSDGGSTDSTIVTAQELFSQGVLNGRVVAAEKGRGRQLNYGVFQAKGEWLLFLHADSRMSTQKQLADSIELLKSSVAGQVLAGRFLLSFDLPPEQHTYSYYFYETKARLGRPGCIHGDQGFLLHRSVFQQIGPFREDLPVMEDTWFAEALRNCGQWLLLPGVLLTSPRRFQSEGLYERQLLNALLMNFLFIGWQDFFREVPRIYRQQSEAECLHLLPFFTSIKDLLAPLSFCGRWRIWFATGWYVRSQAWQLGLHRDCRRNFTQGNPPAEGQTPWVSWFDRWFEPLTDHWLGSLITAGLVRLWFSLMHRKLKKQRGREAVYVNNSNQ